MPYHQFTITIAQEHADRLAQALMDIGSLGVIDQSGTCIAYFPFTQDIVDITRKLAVLDALIGMFGTGTNRGRRTSNRSTWESGSRSCRRGNSARSDASLS
jgi:hypothetical protein